MNQISNYILRIVLAATWPQCKRELAKYEKIVLSDEAEVWLKQASAADQAASDSISGDTGIGSDFDLTLRLLHKCRQVGIDAAVAAFESEPRAHESLGEDAALALMDHTCARRCVRALLEAKDFDGKLAVLGQQPEFLLSPAADELLAGYMDSALQSRNDSLRQFIQQHQLMLLNYKRILEESESD